VAVHPNRAAIAVNRPYFNADQSHAENKQTPLGHVLNSVNKRAIGLSLDWRRRR